VAISFHSTTLPLWKNAGLTKTASHENHVDSARIQQQWACRWLVASY